MTDKQIVDRWWAAIHGEANVNLALIQRPKKVNATSKQFYIYAPSVLCEGFSLKAETVIKILEVHEGATPEETTLKVMEHEEWKKHTHNWYRRSGDLCTFTREQRGDYGEGERPQCGCEKPLAEMPDNLREATHFVLLSDIGK